MPTSGASSGVRLVLDTSAFSRMRAGDARVLERAAAAEIVFMCATVLGELEAGFRRGTRYEENRRTLESFLAEPFVRALDVTPSTARRYGLVFAGLRAQGKPIPVNDIWIAAQTMEAGAHLLTFDRDFDAVAGLDHTLLVA